MLAPDETKSTPGDGRVNLELNLDYRFSLPHTFDSSPVFPRNPVDLHLPD